MNMIKTRTWTTALALCIAASGAIASNSKPSAGKFVMSAVEDSAAGQQILAGQYKDAAEKINKGSNAGLDKYAKATNLCVSLTLSEQFKEAEAPCKSAVRQSRRSSHIYTLSSEGLADARVQRAIALSNFGVLKVLTGDLDAAQSYFEKAANITDAIENPSQNLVHLETVRSKIAKR